MSSKSTLIRFGVWFTISIVTIAFLLESVMNMRFAGNVLFATLFVSLIVGIVGVMHHHGRIHYVHTRVVFGGIFSLVSGLLLLGSLGSYLGDRPLWNIDNNELKMYITIVFVASLMVLASGIHGMYRSRQSKPLGFLRKKK